MLTGRPMLITHTNVFRSLSLLWIINTKFSEIFYNHYDVLGLVEVDRRLRCSAAVKRDG